MKNSYKAALVAALGLTVASAAHAASANDTLYLGFTESSASSDIILDLGTASTFAGTGTTVVDLSSDLTTAEQSAFSTLFGTGNGANLSVIGGLNTLNKGNVYGTQTRVGGAGTAATPGSSVSINVPSGNLTGAAGTLTALGAFPTTAGAYVSDSTKSFSGAVNPAGANNYVAKSGLNPNAAIGSSEVYADLWEVLGSSGTQTAADVYEGYFTFDDSGSSPVLTFTPADVTTTSVPEPTTYGLIAGAGLLIVSLRNKFSRKNA